MKPQEIGVLGLGTMGIGLAYTFSNYGYQVIAVDNNPLVLEQFDANLEDSFKTHCLFGKPKCSLDEIKTRITLSSNMSALNQCDFIVENTTELSDQKKILISELTKITKPNCIIAINTSCIPITNLTKHSNFAERVVGIHFMNPVAIKHFVEIIKTEKSIDQTLMDVKNLLLTIDKSGIVVNDHPGFVINRVLMVTINEAIKVFQEKICNKPHEIDELFVKCLGHRMGPLMTADLIGLDTILYSLNVLFEEFNNDMYKPAQLLIDLVKNNQLGRKTKLGIYDYEASIS